MPGDDANQEASSTAEYGATAEYNLTAEHKTSAPSREPLSTDDAPTNAAAAGSVAAAKAALAGFIAELGDLGAIESLIREKLGSDAPRLHEIGHYLLNLGGKRIRPVLCLLVARALGLKRAPQPLIDVAAGIELIHMATLLHDDIIDNSSLRRHHPSAFARYGLGDSLLTGDFLLVRAFSLCARLDSAIIDATERACVELTEGEILETPLTREVHTVDSSLTIARKKTAALFRLAAYSAAHIAAVDDVLERRLAQFGESLGIAFQILDDVLDVTSSEDLLGKRAGTDLRERKPSLVNVLWLDSGDSRAGRLKRPATSDSADEDRFIAEALSILANGPVVAQARTIARRYAGDALSVLEEIRERRSPPPDEHALLALRSLVEYCILRLQ